MQGMWKTKICGFNHKGTRRKKQKRKHFFKDKFFKTKKRFDREMKNFDSSIINESSLIVEECLSDYGSSCRFAVHVFLVEVSYREDCRFYKEGYKNINTELVKVYFDTYNSAYVYNTGETLEKHLGLEEKHLKIFKGNELYSYSIRRNFDVKIKILKEIDYIKWDISDKDRFKVEDSSPMTTQNSSYWYYGKKVMKYQEAYDYYFNTCPKWMHRINNRKERNAVRNWISQKDYEKEIRFSRMWDMYY